MVFSLMVDFIFLKISEFDLSKNPSNGLAPIGITSVVDGSF